MQVNYQYAGSSKLVRHPDHVTFGLSPDLSREEKVSFVGKLRNPLIFRDAMLMLREVIVSDARQKKKERTEFFQWLNGEIDRRIQEHEQYLPHVWDTLQQEIKALLLDMTDRDKALAQLVKTRSKIDKEIEKSDAWRDYNKLEKKFWQFIRDRDRDLWFVLDPVITVHPDQVSFEAFSLDESIYACLAIDMDEFDLRAEPKLGTTNIDFSAKLAQEMERFRTYSDVELSVNPEGFTVNPGVQPDYIEKKVDLPDTWIKGFTQVSSAANLNGTVITLTPVDMYDICSFLRRHKAQKSPRHMAWILEKDQPVKIRFEPFGHELTLQAIYRGDKNREENIWGRQRWLVAEKLLPLAKSFTVKLLGFGMPQFIIADLGSMKMTIGFSSWSANDWVKGTAFNIMCGFIGEGNYRNVYALLKQKRSMTVDDICSQIKTHTRNATISGIGSLLKRGEGYFDAVSAQVRFRQLCNTPIPQELYATTAAELRVKRYLDSGMDHFHMRLSEKNEYVFANFYSDRDPLRTRHKAQHAISGVHNTISNTRQINSENQAFEPAETEVMIDEDGQMSRVACSCQEFKRGPRNISAPCPHILALYITAAKFARLKLEQGKAYRINDIMEVVLA